MELLGMISNRQTEERHRGAEEPQAAKPPVRPVNNAVYRPPQDRYLTTTAESPVQVGTATEAVSVPAMAVSTAAGASVDQRQQTISSDAAKRAYMARVVRRVRANLSYPGEACVIRGGFLATIAFTINAEGDIKGDSLRVIKSSGSAILDSSALKAAQASVPFEPPPEELDIVVDVSFDH